MCENTVVFSLPKSWIIDLGGTIVKHNGYIIDDHDTLLDGSRDLDQIFKKTTM